MRHIPLVVGAAVVVAAIVALLSTHAITAGGQRAEPQLSPLGIMQMMRDAKDLPVQQFDTI